MYEKVHTDDGTLHALQSCRQAARCETRAYCLIGISLSISLHLIVELQQACSLGLCVCVP